MSFGAVSAQSCNPYYIHIVSFLQLPCITSGHYETLTSVDSAPGTVHWHGADDGCYMVHEASSFGKVDWYDPVTDEEYAAKKG